VVGQNPESHQTQIGHRRVNLMYLYEGQTSLENNPKQAIFVNPAFECLCAIKRQHTVDSGAILVDFSNMFLANHNDAGPYV
jgi:hypothetical protein